IASRPPEAAGGMKRDLAGGMMRWLRAPSPARRSLMAQSTAPRLRFQFFRLRRQAPAQPGLGLDGVLPEATVEQALRAAGASWKRAAYPPCWTFWASFWQGLGPDHSCRAAVKRIAAWLGRRGQEIDDEDTGAYCKARARLPESVPFRLMRSLGHRLH